MKNKRMLQILALVVVLSMIFTTAAFAAPGHKQFEHYNKKYELKAEDYENALKSLINKEIVKGYGNGDYGLSGNVKRGDVIVMIIRMLENDKSLNLNDYDDMKAAFEDVYESDYYYDSVKKAQKLGIAKGDGKSFKPNKPVTIQEAIWLVARASDELGFDITVDSVIEDLEGIYEGEESKFAKRRDVFWMLYYVLDMVEVDENEDNDFLKYTIDINDVLNFDGEVEDDIIEAFEDETDKDFDQIKFVLPDKEDGILYFGYDANNTTKVPVGEFSTDHIDDITFVPERAGNVNIKYTVYDEDGHGYSETITIIVEKEFKIPNFSTNMKLSDEELAINFKETLKDLINNNTLFSDLESVKFILPRNFNGELLINIGNRDKVVSTTEYDLSKIVDITYKPDKVGTVNIEYKVYDEDQNAYDGLIKITVNKDTILEISKTMNENSLLNLKKVYFEEFLDEVKFILPNNGDGVLYEEVKHSSGELDLVELTNEKRTFKYNELDKIYFEPVQDEKGNVTIEYIGYDGTVEYTGKINLTIKGFHDLDTVNWDIDEDYTSEYELDFTSKLDKIDASLDNVKILNPVKGTLSLKYYDKDDNDYDYIEIGESTKYKLNDIEKMFYHPKGEGPIYIYYTAFDGDVSYEGAIRIYVVD